MHSAGTIRIDLDKFLYSLFCLYALSMPFELILEQLFNIDTVLKPFRVISLSIAGVYFVQVLRNGFFLNPEEKGDVFLYLVFGYGILVTCVQVLIGMFSFKLFFNDLFLTGLHLMTFFVFKTMDFSKKQILKIVQFFVLGVLINAAYIFHSFIFKIQFGRQSGFIDNPNYAALGLVAVMTYLVLKTNYSKKFWNHILSIVLLLFVVYIFVITGSRAGLIMFLIALIFLFSFSSFRRKIILLFISGVIVFQIVNIESEYVSLGGSMVLINRVNQKMKSETEDVRFIIWRGVFRALEDRGYWGMGIGQFKANFTKYYGEESNKLVLEIVNRGYYLSPHNDYLAILADYGLPSLLLYLTFLTVAFKRVLRRVLYDVIDEDKRFIAQYSFIILSCLVIFGLSAENFQHQLFWFLLMISTKSY